MNSDWCYLFVCAYENGYVLEVFVSDFLLFSHLSGFWHTHLTNAFFVAPEHLKLHSGRKSSDYYKEWWEEWKFPTRCQKDTEAK